MYPVLFRVGFLNFYSYGFFVALGIIIATYFAKGHAKIQGIPAAKIVDLVFWMIVAGLIGGRIVYVILNFDEYLNQPFEILKIYKGGLVFHGGFVFALISTLIFIKRNKLPSLKTLDIIAVYVPLAHAFGRIGCFFNGCCFGRPAQLMFSVMFPGDFVRRHPTQLYSAILLFCIFLSLLFLERKKEFGGQVFFAYCMMYGLMRFFIEFRRADNPQVLGAFSLFQIISVVLFIVGLLGYLIFKIKKNNSKIE